MEQNAGRGEIEGKKTKKGNRGVDGEKGWMELKMNGGAQHCGEEGEEETVAVVIQDFE
jgi:hypothetical protein